MEGIESKHRARQIQRNPWGRHREASTEQEKNQGNPWGGHREASTGQEKNQRNPWGRHGKSKQKPCNFNEKSKKTIEMNSKNKNH